MADLLVTLRSGKEMHRQWKQGHVARDEYREAVQMCRDGIRKVKAWMELSMARDTQKQTKQNKQTNQTNKTT